MFDSITMKHFFGGEEESCGKMFTNNMYHPNFNKKQTPLFESFADVCCGRTVTYPYVVKAVKKYGLEDDFRALEKQLGYTKEFTLKKDYCVNMYVKKFQGKKYIIIDHSCIQYFFELEV